MLMPFSLPHLVEWRATSLLFGYSSVVLRTSETTS